MKETIIYDGHCKFCQAQVTKIKSKDLEERFDYVSSSNNLKPYKVSKEQAQQGLIFIDTQKHIFHKAAAVEQIYRRTSKHHIFSWGRKVPLLKQAIDLGYKFIARYRYNLYGRCDDECKI